MMVPNSPEICHGESKHGNVFYSRERVSRVSSSRPFRLFFFRFCASDFLISGKKEFGIFDVIKSRVDSKAIHQGDASKTSIEY